MEKIDGPAHYGGKDSQYEVIKIFEAFGLGPCASNALKYVLRAGKKGDEIEDLSKGAWYLERWLQNGESGCTFSIKHPFDISHFSDIIAFHDVRDHLHQTCVLHILTGYPSSAALCLRRYLEKRRA